MKYVFNSEQLSVLKQTLDVAVKATGLQGLYTIVELVQVLEAPLNKPTNEVGPFFYDMSADQVTKFELVFDVAIKTVGLKGATNIIAMAQVLASPLPEEEQPQAEEVEVLLEEEAPVEPPAE